MFYDYYEVRIFLRISTDFLKKFMDLPTDHQRTTSGPQTTCWEPLCYSVIIEVFYKGIYKGRAV